MAQPITPPPTITTSADRFTSSPPPLQPLQILFDNLIRLRLNLLQQGDKLLFAHLLTQRVNTALCCFHVLCYYCIVNSQLLRLLKQFDGIEEAGQRQCISIQSGITSTQVTQRSANPPLLIPLIQGLPHAQRLFVIHACSLYLSQQFITVPQAIQRLPLSMPIAHLATQIERLQPILQRQFILPQLVINAVHIIERRTLSMPIPCLSPDSQCLLQVLQSELQITLILIHTAQIIQCPGFTTSRTQFLHDWQSLLMIFLRKLCLFHLGIDTADRIEQTSLIIAIFRLSAYR